MVRKEGGEKGREKETEREWEREREFRGRDGRVNVWGHVEAILL